MRGRSILDNFHELSHEMSLSSSVAFVEAVTWELCVVPNISWLVKLITELGAEIETAGVLLFMLLTSREASEQF